jgi:hypothetical protein
MKFNIIIFIALVTINFCLFTRVVSAQPQLWEIYSTSNQPFINVTVDKYESDSLYIKSTGQIFILHQDSIKYLLKRRESNFGLGFLFGAITGGVLGATSSSGSDGFFSGIGEGLSIALGALVGGVLGGVVGLASGADKKYQLEKLNTEHKRKLLNWLFN